MSDMRQNSLVSSAIINLITFIFAIMKFHLIHFSQRSSSAQPFNLFFFWYVAICSNSIRSFLICSIWMFHHSPYYSIWINSNWIFSILFPSKHSLMVTLYLLSFKYFKLNISIMDYNTVTEDIIRLSDYLNTWSSTLCIPVKDSESLLDFSSAANDADSCVPPITNAMVFRANIYF